LIKPFEDKFRTAVVPFWEVPVLGIGGKLGWYIGGMYSQKFQVDVVIRGERRACPWEWLDQFCMRNFTNAADFDDTLPVGEGRVEASFRVTPERFAEGLGAWLTQRGKGEGQPVGVEVTRC
jgi:hypothetical protein